MESDKKALRKHIIKMRSDMDDKTCHRLSHFIIDKLKETDEYLLAKTVAIYLSYNHEVETWSFIEEILGEKNICVPVVNKNNQMHFVQIDNLSHLKKNKYGIYEPVFGNIIDKNNIDLIVVPIVGFYNNYRLGYGGGYYDRYLQDYPGKTIGIAFKMQKLDFYVPEKHDIPLNKIITE